MRSNQVCLNFSQRKDTLLKLTLLNRISLAKTMF